MLRGHSFTAEAILDTAADRPVTQNASACQHGKKQNEIVGAVVTALPLQADAINTA